MPVSISNHPHVQSHCPSGAYPQSCSQSSILVMGFPRKVRYQISVGAEGRQNLSLQVTPFSSLSFYKSCHKSFPPRGKLSFKIQEEYYPCIQIVDISSLFSLCPFLLRHLGNASDVKPTDFFPPQFGKRNGSFPLKKKKEQTQSKTRKAQNCICDFCLLLNKQKNWVYL